MNGWRVAKIVSILIVIIALIIIYKRFDPSSNIGFPKCPSLLLTGYQCAGCGSQRAIHHLLNFNIGAAMGYNPLVVLLIPYVFFLFLLESSKDKYGFKRLYDLMTGREAIILLIITIIIYSIIRNL